MHFKARQRLRISIGGLVQGVGFRPFVCRLALGLELAGWVRNTGGGVEIEAEGPAPRLRALQAALHEESPPLARIERVEVVEIEAGNADGFAILDSAAADGDPALISPDIAICPECRQEMRDPSDRRYHYPFINCTGCGPRFTIAAAVPYDRARTSMARFRLCPSCRREYGDKRDRRFHAEPIACPDCGPRISLMDPAGAPLATGGGAIEAARKYLNAGRIIAVKGLGGFHLACDASSERAISRLRARKSRPHRPLAIMCRDLGVVRSICELSEKEAQELSSPRCPILLLARRRTVDRRAPSLSRLIAPGREDLGVMLPYTPLHDLLLAPGGPECAVMTSANRSGEPIIADDGEALALVGDIVDAILTHDREIVNRCDDSVAYMEDERLVLLRRSRGFAPLPVPLSRPVRPTLALGAMSSNAFAIAAGRRAFLSQHIGDVDNLASLAFLRSAIASFRAWLGIEPEIVAHDMHPDILTTRLAREIADGRRRVPVQHHHAHLASAMAAAGIDGEVQGLVFDGTGWAPDGTIWGGELLVGGPEGFRRAGHLLPLPLPGGDAAVRRPLRLAVACLHSLVPEADGAPLDLWRRARPGEAETVRRMVDRGFNAPATSSAGRLFDAVAALIGLRDEISYEGQAAMELEQLACRADGGARRLLRFPVVSSNGEILMDSGPLLHDLVQGVLDDEDGAALALAFHGALAGAAAEACVAVSEAGGPETVLLCGGVFQNRLLSRMTIAALEEAGLRAVAPGLVPPGDGGLALGQLLVANASEVT